jgi:hypothetical protein
VTFTLLVGARQMKLDISLVEKLFEHAASVQLVRLTSAGRNALDFTLAYHVGRAVAADPSGLFHIISKDAGFDPLIAHLRSRHIKAYRHNDFVPLTFAGSTRPSAPIPAATAKPKPQPKPKARSLLDEREAHVLEHLGKVTTTRPRNEQKLLSYLVAHFGNKITETEASDLVRYLSQAGHLTIGERGVVTYHLK